MTWPLPAAGLANPRTAELIAFPCQPWEKGSARLDLGARCLRKTLLGSRFSRHFTRARIKCIGGANGPAANIACLCVTLARALFAQLSHAAFISQIIISISCALRWTRHTYTHRAKTLLMRLSNYPLIQSAGPPISKVTSYIFVVVTFEGPLSSEDWLHLDCARLKGLEDLIADHYTCNVISLMKRVLAPTYIASERKEETLKTRRIRIERAIKFYRRYGISSGDGLY